MYICVKNYNYNKIVNHILIGLKQMNHNHIAKYNLDPPNSPEVPKDFHLNLRKRFMNALRQQNSHKQKFNKSVCFFKGIPTVYRNYDDVDENVDQQSTFWYLFGVKQADCYALIQNQNAKTTIFIPRLPESLKMWMYIKPKQVVMSDSQADQVLFVDQMQDYLRKLNLQQIYFFYGKDSDSGLEVDIPEQKYWNFVPSVDKQTLWILISNLRVIKTEDQIKLLKYVCKISSQAHISAIKSARAGLKQIQMQAVFQFQHTHKTASNKTGYHSICASGQDCATLHYIDNDKTYYPGQMVLHDMGGKWYGYTSDITVTFPIDGKFTKQQRQIYHAVYLAQKSVFQAVKPGVNWEDMHLLAQRIMNQQLGEIGIINNFPMEQLIEKRVGAVFFPHGLGHFLGLKVHDLGGFTKGNKKQKSTLAGICKLRTRRDMQQGMVITVEPGLYFIDFIIKAALQGQNSKYYNKQKIEQYQQVGGVRLEDVIVITKNGCEIISNVPRHWQQLQKLLAQ